jgi:hypothetical protein
VKKKDTIPPENMNRYLIQTTKIINKGERCYSVHGPKASQTQPCQDFKKFNFGKNQVYLKTSFF